MVDPCMRRATADFDDQRGAAFACADHVAAGPAGFGIEHGTRATGGFFDMGSGAAGADFFVSGVQDLHRIGQRTGALECFEREAIEHQAAFHVGDAGAKGEVAIAAVAARRGGAFGEHRVAMAQ
ncbi:hypothetical protein D3C85_1340060 [compost metagenome]